MLTSAFPQPLARIPAAHRSSEAPSPQSSDVGRSTGRRTPIGRGGTASAAFAVRCASPAAARRRGRRHDHRHACRDRLVRAAARRTAADVRRPGGDRDRERAPVQRDQGSTRAADRHLRSAAGDQQLGGRHGARVRQDPDRLRAPVQRRPADGLPARRAGAPRARSDPRARCRADRAHAPHVPDAARRHRDRAGDPRAPPGHVSPTC